MFFINNKSDVLKKANNIKAVLFDIDGVLTDGGIIYDDSYQEYKRYNVKDGQIIKYLKESGFIVGAITGRESNVVKKRCDELKLDFHRHGVNNKLIEYQSFKEQYQFEDHHIAYIGDDVIDLSILVSCGLSVCPYDARDYIKKYVDIVTPSKGGEGVLRDAADFILDCQGLLNILIEKSVRVV